MASKQPKVAHLKSPCQNRNMSLDDNTELLSQYAQSRNPRLRDRIFAANLGLAKNIASKFSKNTREPYEDLEQVAAIGLLKAIENFDVSRGYKLSSYAVPKIRSEIHHYLRDKCEPIKIPRSWVDKSPKVKRLTEAGLDENAIAREARLKVEELPMLRQAFRRLPLISLSQQDDREGEGEGAPAIQIADDREYLNLVSVDQVLAMAGAPPQDNFFNATALCKQHQRVFHEFWRLPSTQRRVKELSKEGLSLICKSRRGHKGGTYLHVAIAVEFLSWVSPEYKNLLRQSAYGNLSQLYGEVG